MTLQGIAFATGCIICHVPRSAVYVPHFCFISTFLLDELYHFCIFQLVSDMEISLRAELFEVLPM